MHHKKLILLSLVACSLLNASSQLVNETFVGREWEFMEYKFRHRPTLKSFCKVVGITTLMTALGGLGGYFFFQNSRDPVSFAFIGGAFSFFISAIVSEEAVKISDRLKKGIKFIKHWPKNKPYTPANLHTTFDELYNLYLDQGKSERFMQEYKKIFSVIMYALYHRFPPIEHQSVRYRTDIVYNPAVPSTTLQPSFVIK